MIPHDRRQHALALFNRAFAPLLAVGRRYPALEEIIVDGPKLLIAAEEGLVGLDLVAETGLRPPDIRALCDNAAVYDGAQFGEVPPARLFDELLKLFHSGHAVRSFELLIQYDLLQYLFKDTNALLATAERDKLIEFVRTGLASTDSRVQADKPVTPMFLYAVFLWFPIRELAERLQSEGWNEAHAMAEACHRIVAQQQTTFPRRSNSRTCEFSATIVLPFGSRSASDGALSPCSCQTVLPSRSISTTTPLLRSVTSVLPFGSRSASCALGRPLISQTIWPSGLTSSTRSFSMSAINVLPFGSRSQSSGRMLVT